MNTKHPHPDDCPVLSDPEKYLGPNRRGWHIEKTLSVGHLLTTLAIAGSFLVWAMTREARLVMVEEAIRALSQTVSVANSRHDAEIRDIYAVMRDEVKAIHGKLDRVIERQPQPSR